ncbi:mitochondrial antiviral-signaling protein [Heteronotia binoei]|uniref:mitochondrial antiviral-signaling protein n=1 Tax=Heteronotia binoei TaxID=13085 RepID=UPI002931C0FB|nr:mitochondrial antiviral-signaling protein [Heteronotia binoei]
MGFAEDKVKEYIERNYHRFHNVRLNQLLDFLPCLTAADRQQIRCSTDRHGDILSVHNFFSHLWCRRGWVTDLIAALENNNSELADVIRNVYQNAQLPRRPPVAQCSPSPAPAPVRSSTPSSDDPPLSPPRNQPRPTRDPLPTCANALPCAHSASLQDVVDYMSPVQESPGPSGSSESALKEKPCGKDMKKKVYTPDQRNRNAAASDVSLEPQPENPANAQIASPSFPVQHPTPLGEESEMEMQNSTPVSSSSDAGNLVRNWDGFQPRPVCVENGYFGNLSRSVDSGLSPAPELAVSSASTASSNQPEENSYLSSDSSPLTPRGHAGAQVKEEKIPPLWDCQREDRLDNPANRPVLRLEVDEKQKGAQDQRDSTRNVNAVPLFQKEDDRHSWQVNSRRLDFRNLPDDANQTGSIPANLQRGKMLPPSIPSETVAASCFEQDSSRGCSEDVSHDRRQRCEATPAGGQLPEGCQAVPKGNTVDLETRGPFAPGASPTASSLGQSPSDGGQLPQRSLGKERFGQIPGTVPVGRFRPPPSDGSCPSSTNVIPPSSPVVVSAALSDGYQEDLKHPVQEIASGKMMEDIPPRATAACPSYATDIPANSRDNKDSSSRSSRGTVHGFRGDYEEEDLSLLKPGILVSQEIIAGAVDQLSSIEDREYSGTSERLRFSSEWSDESDPLLLSDSTQGSCSEASGRNTSMGTNSASLHRQNGDDFEGGSVITHTVRVVEPPSIDLSGAPEMIHTALRDARQPPGDVSDSVAGDRLTKNGSSRSVHDNSRQNSRQNKSAGDAASHVSDLTILTVGFTLGLAIVAFVLYKRLKK